MEKHPPKKRARPSRAQSVELLKGKQTGFTIAKAAAIGKPGRPFVDAWIQSRIHYLAPQVTRQAGPVARRFLKEAKSRYQQYRRCGCPRLRFLAWSALDIVAGQLVGGAACSGEALRA